MYKRFFKRVIDFLVSFFALILLSPVLLVLIICLYFSNSGQVFFIQLRPGKHGKLFNIIKFKTMNDKRDGNGVLLPDNARITPVGGFVRRKSLDEILQLINVLKGDMSLIGPRPLLPQYLPLYDEVQSTRHNVRPGITGWAQVNGRNAISWKEKFTLDVYYVNNYSLQLDMKILYLTFTKVVKGDGVNMSAEVTMEAFSGNN
jgi:undecaprenyl phosphate N,N'-diacetylbacillosamine 1-phosphate transferase